MLRRLKWGNIFNTYFNTIFLSFFTRNFYFLVQNDAFEIIFHKLWGFRYFLGKITFSLTAPFFLPPYFSKISLNALWVTKSLIFCFGVRSECLITATIHFNSRSVLLVGAILFSESVRSRVLP